MALDIDAPNVVDEGTSLGLIRAVPGVEVVCSVVEGHLRSAHKAAWVFIHLKRRRPRQRRVHHLVQLDLTGRVDRRCVIGLIAAYKAAVRVPQHSRNRTRSNSTVRRRMAELRWPTSQGSVDQTP